MTPLCEALAALAAQGRTAQQAADEIGMTAKSARMLGYRHGFRFIGAGKLTVQRVREAAAAGMTQTEAAAALPLERTWLNRLAKAHGIRFTTPAQRLARARAEAALAAAEAKAVDDAERMVRWRAAWEAKKAARAPAPAPVDPIEAMRRVAARESAAMRDRRAG